MAGFSLFAEVGRDITPGFRFFIGGLEKMSGVELIEVFMSQKSDKIISKGRAKNIPQGWRLVTVGQVCSIRNDLRLPIAVEERRKINGEYPYYGPTGILSYINEYRLDGKFALIGEDGDHFLKYKTKAQTLLVEGKFNVNNHAHVIASTKDCSAEWFYNFFRYRNIFTFLTRQGAGRYKLNKDALKNIPILIPSQVEQRKISDFINLWDSAIEKTERLIAAKERRFEGYIAKLINYKKYSLSHIREFTSEISQRNTANACDLILSVTNHSGFVLPEEQFEKRVASVDLSNYKIVCRRQYAYNPSRINVGSIARLDKWDKGVLSPMYIVFGLNEKEVDSDFFRHWLSSNGAKQRIKRSAQGSVRESVGYNDFGSIVVPLPSLARQKEISNILNKIESEIILWKTLVEKYREKKRGLMQKLLTGEWRAKM